MTKHTFLYDKHIALKAKIIDFAGWLMPVQYTSIITEHKAVRNGVGIFDVSHMGELFVRGKDSALFLNSLVPQDILKLTVSKAVYCQLTNEHGGIIDDLIIYKLEENNFLLILNASRADVDYDWIIKHKSEFNVNIDNQSANYSLLAVQGPLAQNLMNKLGLINLPEFFHIKSDQLDGIEILISRTGYTGEDGFEILFKNKFAETLWDKLIDAGEEFGITPVGLGARDTLRLEAALHLYGNELNENITPIEAGLSWSVAKNKTENYIGKDVILNHFQNGVDKKLIALKMNSRAIPRHEHDVFFNNEKIGFVTSGGFSPILNENIALAYVKNIKDICLGTTVQIMIREKLHDAIVVKKPFIDKKNTVNTRKKGD